MSRASTISACRALCFVGCALMLNANVVVAAADDDEEAELSRDDFAYGVLALPESNAAAYRASMPLVVYQKILRGDLGDVRVFNERDEVVPYRIERPRSESTVQGAPVPLPIFTLRDDSREALDAIRVTIESGGARVDVQAPVGARGATTARIPSAPTATVADSSSTARGSPTARGSSTKSDLSTTARGASTSTGSSPVVSYVLDGRSLTTPIANFQLAWPDNAADFAGRLRIEASDDLGTWQTVVTGAPIANLRAGDARIVEGRVQLAGVSTKYWRLSWADAPAPFEITSVVAEPARNRVDVVRQALAVQGTAVPERRGEFEFDLGARVPIDRINLELPEQNSIVEVELLSRALPTQPWRPVTRGGFYRLKSTRPIPISESATVEANADLTNGALLIEANADRYWLARIDTRGGGLGRGAPKLRVGWLPHDVVFLARGTGPFTLAYGSSKAQPTTALGSIPSTVSILSTTFSEPEQLGGDVRLQPATPERTSWSKPAILWTVLGIGVALLAFMAYRLVRDLNKTPNGPKESP